MPTFISDLLATKLYIPPTRSQLVSRPRLIDQLNTCTDYKLTLVSAPAGFGKTTLLSEWAGQTDLPVAWLSLDEGDNECGRLLAHVVAALRTLKPDLGESVLAALQAPQLPSFKALITKLVNDLAACPEHLILVFDDYHHIASEDVFQSMTFLLEHFPPQAHLIIATRSDPPLALSRLWARGEMAAIRTNDLRFTPQETMTFFNQVMDLNLSNEAIQALEQRTEGWITGLQLAALSLQNHPNVADFITQFSGRHHHVLDYLADEVFKQQPQPIQEFLLKTSLLERLCGPLGDAILGGGAEELLDLDYDRQGDKGTLTTSPSSPSFPPTQQPMSSQEILAYLKQANLFIVPLDSEQRWYRYHHLFTDCLRYYLHLQVGPDGIIELHQRAATWFSENGLLEEAVKHALAANDPDRAANLVEQEIPGLSSHIEKFTILFRLLRMLPEEIIRTRPRLCLEYAWVLFILGKFNVDIIASFVQTATQLMSDNAIDFTNQPELPGILASMKAITANMRGDFEQVVSANLKALALLPSENLQWRSTATFVLGSAQLALNDLLAATQTFDEANHIAFSNRDLFKALYIIGFQGRAQVWQGQLHRAAMTYQQAIDITNEADIYQAAMIAASSGLAYVGLGEIKYEWDDLNGAAQTLIKGIELAQQWEVSAVPEIFALGYTALARVRQAQGDVEGAGDMLRQVERVAKNVRTPLILAQSIAGQIRVWLAQGDIEMAIRWADATENGRVGANTTTSVQRPLCLQIAVSRVRLAQYMQARAKNAICEILAVLVQYQQQAEDRGYFAAALELIILQALAHQALDDMPRAETLLIQALARAEPEGYIRLFVDEGPPMTQLLLRLVKKQQKEHRPINQVSPAYMGRLLAASGVKVNLTAKVNGHLRVDLNVAPLTEREIEILRLVADGMSNQEIAQQLIISVGTIKRHLSNIYKKLDVHSRTQAVVQAQEQGLI